MIISKKILVILLSSSLLSFCECTKLSSIDKLYKKGFDAYSEERWSECIVQFEESLHLYKLYKSININCRLKCNSQEYEYQLTENIEDLKIYEKFFHKRDCLTKCQEKAFNEVHMHSELDQTIQYLMQNKKPYEYLHLCYFEMYALPKAASAAYTYLIANPDDEAMKNNLQYYVQQPEVNTNEVVDLESEDYKVLYELGLKAYKQSNWAETIAAMEESLKDYLYWENTCRAECDQYIEHEWSPEFLKTVSNIFTSLLRCRQKCQDKLKSFNYNSGVEFVADVLNYLQISYYRLDRFGDAAKTVSSYLVLMPEDEDMLENKRIYRTLIDEEEFTTRSDIVYYYKRDTYEKKLLKFFHHGDDDNTDFNSTK